MDFSAAANSTLTPLAVVLALMLILPRLFERMKLPGMLGLITGGILLGPHGFRLIGQEHPAVDVLSEIGKLMIMFFAGLEIDLAKFRQVKARSLAFGLSTFSVPLLFGLAIGRHFGYGWPASFLIGSLMSSHTLLALPLLQKMGLMRNNAVTITVGATVFTDVLSLVVLAMCLSIHTSGFSPTTVIRDLVELAIYIPLLVVGMGRIMRWALDRLGDNELTRSYVLLLTLMVAALGAELIHLEGLVGAFLAGLSVNAAMRGRAIHDHLESVGHMLFIPAFFLTTGLLIDFGAFGRVLHESPLLVVAVVVGLVLSKWIASQIAGRSMHFDTPTVRLMWSLTLPQVAATLAATIAGYQALNAQGERLLDTNILNSVLVLMTVTAALGPVLTARFGKEVLASSTPAPPTASPAAAPAPLAGGSNPQPV